MKRWERVLLAVAIAYGLCCGCAHAPAPPLWEVCRDFCGAHGAVKAAVVGAVDPRAPPVCMCASSAGGGA